MKKYFLAVLVIITAIIVGYSGYLRFKKPLVSVVMLTYKRADIAPKAIDSILAQTFKDFEFIILNDGSPDNTDEMIKKYSDSRIRYYKNDKNRGIAYSRNRAAALARGKYIMIMDDDDESMPDRMQKEVEFLEKHPEIDVVAGQIKDLPRIPQTHDEIAAGLIQYNNFGNSNIMYRRDFAEKHNIKYDNNLKVCEDWDLWLKMLFAGAKLFALNDDILIRYGNSAKHYHSTERDCNMVKENVGKYFHPENGQAFYEASACDKLQMIKKAPVVIFNQDYLNRIIAINCPSL